MLKYRFIFLYFIVLCSASYHEQYRVPQSYSDKWESFIFNNKEYLVQNLAVNWENAKIICKGFHNASLAVIDSIEKAEFLAEALSESQFTLSSVWVGARRDSAEDPQGYRWGAGRELRRTALDVLHSETDTQIARRYPVWLNRTHVPVPEGGADCVAMERVNHDHPVFLDLPCQLERAFACERDAKAVTSVQHVNAVRCGGDLFHLFDGMMDWHEAAAYCVLRGMALANIGTLKCMKRLGLTMLKNRPSIERAWVGAKGTLGVWTWHDSGLNIFQLPPYTDAKDDNWPPMRDRANVKQNGCLQLDRHESHPPVFLEARCERKMQFICYEGLISKSISVAPPSDDSYIYILVKQKYYWQHAFDNCIKMNGTLASMDNNDILIQLLLVMGENKDEPVEHVWVSGRLKLIKDMANDLKYIWYNPVTTKRIPDPRANASTLGAYFMPPWLDEESNIDNSCLNLDRQDHLTGLVYGLPCDTAQYSICMIEKTIKRMTTVENDLTNSQSSLLPSTPLLSD